MRRSWIKIETNTPDKPEICSIASQLRLDTDTVMGKLVRLWSWAELNVSDGNETTVTIEFLDKLVGKKGFAVALESAGWLKKMGNRLVFPHFDRHNGKAAKGRAQTALRVSRHRARKADREVLETPKTLQNEVLSEPEAEPTLENPSEDIHVLNMDEALINNEQKEIDQVQISPEDDTLEQRKERQQEEDPAVMINAEEVVADVTIYGALPSEPTEDASGAKRRTSRSSKKADAEEQPLLF